MTGGGKSDNIELEHLRIVSDFAIDMLSVVTTEQVLWHLARNVVARLNFQDVVVYIYDDARNELIQRSAFGHKSPGSCEILDPIVIPVGKGVVGRAAATRVAQCVSDTRNIPDYIVDVGAGLSELAVPMLASGRLVGVIDSEHPETNFYTPQHIRTLTAIAAIAATKILKQQALDQLQQTVEQLEYSSKIQHVLFEIAELIFQTDSLKEFYRRLHTCIGRLKIAKNFYIALCNKDNTQVSLPYCVDEFDDVAEDEVIPLDANCPSLTGYVLKQRQSLLLSEQDILQKVAKGEIYVVGTMPKSWLGVPFGDGALSGLVVVQSYQSEYAFTEKDRSLLVFVSKHIRNAIERFNVKSQLSFLALHDPLTHLPNRTLFSDRIGQAIEKAKRTVELEVAVLYIDLDRFKYVNDTYGHNIGDKLLVEVAKVITACVRSTDTLCRLGGDEFGVLLEGTDKAYSVQRVCAAIIAHVSKIERIDDVNLAMSASVGAALYSANSVTVEQLLVQADEAMYQAKLLGRNQWCFFSDSTMKKTGASHRLEKDFSAALNEGQLFLECQPLVELRGGIIVGAEALVRWHHPEHGLLAPNLFVDALEISGQIVDLDCWVLRQAIGLLSEWRPCLDSDFKLSINVSAKGLCASRFMQTLCNVQEKQGDLLNKLCIEITERSFVEEVEQAKKVLSAVRAMNISVALDDFGTGFSSLSYLHKFQFDSIKIDQSFLIELDVSQDKSIILETIINLAKSLGICSVAEGVESAIQFRNLTLLGCDRAQGFYMSKPVAPIHFLALLRQKITYSAEPDVH